MGLVSHASQGFRQCGILRRVCRNGIVLEKSQHSVGEMIYMGQVTLLLSKLSGVGSAENDLAVLVYEDLRRLAAWRLASEKPGNTLQATALVHEAFVKILRSQRKAEWKDRNHFFACVAEAMRRILVDHARARSTGKRGGNL